MADDNVVPLFKDIPAAEESDAVAEFVEDYLGDFIFAVHNLDHAVTEEDFRAAKDQVEKQVKAWPRV